MFSIIIPTFRQTKKLSKCLNSVLQQTVPNWEIIVIDDNNSTSETRKYVKSLIEKVNDKRIRYFQNAENKNGAYCRNFGTKKASFDNLIFLDDDDELFSKNYLEVFDAIMTKDSRECILYYCGSVLYDNDRPYRVNKPTFKGAQFQIPLLCGQTNFVMGGFVVKKTFVEKFGGFDERLKRFQDAQFMLQFFDSGGIVEPVYDVKVRINYDRKSLRLTYEEYKTAKDTFLFDIVIKNKFLSAQMKKKIIDFHQYDLFIYHLRCDGLKNLVNFQLKYLTHLFSLWTLKKTFFSIVRLIQKNKTY